MSEIFFLKQYNGLADFCWLNNDLIVVFLTQPKLEIVNIKTGNAIYQLDIDDNVEQVSSIQNGVCANNHTVIAVLQKYHPREIEAIWLNIVFD